MRAHNCCILHRLNICSMQCTSYYIGYICTIIKLVVGMEDQRIFALLLLACHTPWWLFADHLHRVTDRPHKVDDWPHEATDWSHQVRVGAFGFFDTNSTPYFTLLSNGSLVPSWPWESSECVALFPAPAQLFVIQATRKNKHLGSAYAQSLPYPSDWPYQNGGQYKC